MISPATAGNQVFRFRSIWQENTANPALEDLIDADDIGTINYVGFTPFTYLKLDDMFEWAGERCPDFYWEGVVSFSLKLQETINYPDFFVVRDWTWTEGPTWERNDVDPFIIWELLCYVDSTDTLFSAKSEKCLMPNHGNTQYATTTNHLIFMVPEETPLIPTNNYVFRVEGHGMWSRGYS